MRPLNYRAFAASFAPSEPTGSSRRASQFPRIAAALLIMATCVTAARAADEAARLKAQQLVTAAAQADIAGDKARNLGLLHDALLADPDNQLAHWQLGEIKVDEKWVSVEESQRRAAADPREADYCKHRAAASQDLQGQLELAKWCRKSKLDDEAKFHFATALSLDPKNEEALRGLDMRWVNGQLVARGEPKQQKQQIQEAKNAAKRWEPIIAKWRRAVAGHDVHAHDAALDEIRAITKLDAIPSIEAVTLGRDAFDMKHAEECLQIGLAFIDALAKMPDQAATESLVRHAVTPPGNKARALAIAKLKLRPHEDYIPILLGGLGMPLESSFSVTTDPSGSVHYTHSVFQEGRDSDRSFDVWRTASQRDLGGRVTRYDTYTDTADATDLPAEAPQVVAAKKARVASASQLLYGQNASVTELKVAQANQAVEAMNSRIIPVLAGTTDKSFESPKDWWDWWEKRTEYYSSEHPVEQYYYSDCRHFTYGFPRVDLYSTAPPPPPPPPGTRRSCFVKGTPVWTKTGIRSIETLEAGDLVLSQDVHSGELTYKPLIGRTVRPPSQIVKITLDGEEILATKGHPFWVSGVGWRMAKELDATAVLHGVTGSYKIRSVESAPEAEAYNLLVADFSTYFVGETGLLVHDNTPRRPTRAAVPGITIK